MQQFCPYGSVRGAAGDRRPYRDESRTACETRSKWATETRRHRGLLRFLRVSATSWQISLYLAARADFHSGLLGRLWPLSSKLCRPEAGCVRISNSG